MKKIILIIAVLALMIGCTGVESPEPEESVIQPEAQESEPRMDIGEDVPAPEAIEEPAAKAEEKEQEEIITAPVETETEKAAEPAEEQVIIPEIQEVIDKAGKAKSYKYVYRGPENRQEVLTYSVRGSRIKVNLPLPTRYNNDSFDTVYLDMGTGDAKGYCENERCETTGFKAYARYNEYKRPTPIDKLEKIIAPAEKVGEAVIGNRKNIIIEYTDAAGLKTRLWIEKFYGMPMKEEVYAADGSVMSLTEYTELAVNSVKDEDVTPQTSSA